MVKEIFYLFFRNSFINLALYTLLSKDINKVNIFIIIGFSIIFSIIEKGLNKKSLIKKYSYRLRFILFYTMFMVFEFMLWNRFKIIDIKLLLGASLLIWVGLIIYVQIINVRFNKESKKYNKVLEEYKSRLKESNKTAMENKFMRSVIYINGEPNENLLTTDSIYSIFIKETDIEIYNINPINMKVKKLKENIPFSEIDLIKISVGNIFRTRGTGFPLKFNYDGEEDRLYKLVYTLELEIKLKSGEVRKINTNEIRDTFNYLINILKEKAINYEDTYNLEKLLKEKDDKELLKYFLKNEIGTDGLAGQYFKNIYRE
ncbi:hypothetical protein [Clostridium thermobutyricum]|uniref:Uncharacterized protein n=1 Tax=Clostridium thermobutyricum DSM 4928 TaxID=1121339 RepID=A0A1V4SZE9_9CLOT|nr:hypothetical protein [Clostridium thermobutyricum]OPX49771.1 hypothetical protein CLTHE_05020 [Clostridium thermobutyricum DSM 4928]